LTNVEVTPTASNVKVFPTVTRGQIFLESKVKMERIILIDQMGNTSSILPNDNISIDSYTNGIYTLQIVTGANIENHRIVKI